MSDMLQQRQRLVLYLVSCRYIYRHFAHAWAHAHSEQNNKPHLKIWGQAASSIFKSAERDRERDRLPWRLASIDSPQHPLQRLCKCHTRQCFFYHHSFFLVQCDTPKTTKKQGKHDFFHFSFWFLFFLFIFKAKRLMGRHGGLISCSSAGFVSFFSDWKTVKKTSIGRRCVMSWAKRFAIYFCIC